jgi:phospholipid/cholesterol/gamma-HCH transport system substrate-binding protein
LKIEFENVDGLTTGAEVHLRGKKVGEVNDMEITNGGSKIIVKVKIENNLKIPIGSTFTIYSSDLTGNRAVNVELANSEEYLDEKDLIIGRNQQSLGDKVDKELKQTKAQFESLLIGVYDNKLIEVMEDNESFTVIKFHKSTIGDTLIKLFDKSLNHNSPNQQINK